MAKRKNKPPANPTASDLPKGPTFQRFTAFTSAIMQVPKLEIDALMAEERRLKEALATDIEEIEERLAPRTACEPE